MKKKTNLVALAGLALAAGAWHKLAGDFPITAPPPPAELPGPDTECPTGFYRKLIEGQWRCWPSYRPVGEPPDCGQFSTPKWDAAAKTWRCVPKGLL